MDGSQKRPRAKLIERCLGATRPRVESYRIASRGVRDPPRTDDGAEDPFPRSVVQLGLRVVVDRKKELQVIDNATAPVILIPERHVARAVADLEMWQVLVKFVGTLQGARASYVTQFVE